MIALCNHSTRLLVETVNLIGEILNATFLALLVLDFSLRSCAPEVVLVLVEFLAGSRALGTTEDVRVLLLGEVHVIHSVWMWELSWIITIVLPSGVGSHVLCATVSPVLDGQVADRLALVIVTDGHGSLVGLIVNGLSSEHPLSLLSEGLENVIWAHLHDRDLLVEASLFTLLGSACLILLDLSIATSWNSSRLQSHELRVLHVGVALTTVFVTECFCFSIWVPFIVCLDMSMIFVKGVVQVAVDPRKLWNVTEKEGSLRIVSCMRLVSLSKWIQTLVQVGVNNLVTEIPMRFTLMPIVLWL